MLDELLPVGQYQRVEQGMLLMFSVIAHLHPLQCVVHQRDALVNQQQVPCHGIVSGNDCLLTLAEAWIGNDYRMGVSLLIMLPTVRGGIQ